MAKKEMGQGMKSPTMPKKEFERHYDNLKGCDMRYCSEMNAAEEYERANNGLADYVKKHAMKNS
jgi:hypothetical protein